MIFLLCSVVLLYIIYTWLTIKPKQFPPGPPTIPILGSLPFLPKENAHIIMEEWRTQYGAIVGLVLGNELAVAVVEPKVVKEVLKREEFQGRPINKVLAERSFGRRIGIMFSDGNDWQVQRRFTIRHMKEFGFGKTSMEDIMIEEISDLIDEIKDQKLQVSGLFNISSVNVLWAIMAGKKYKRSDPMLQKLMNLLNKVFRTGNSIGGNLRFIFPFLKYIIPNWESPVTTVAKELNAFIMQTIKEHYATLDENNPRDFIDVYLTEINAQKESITSFDEETLTIICNDLFSAGAESVANALGFALMYMVLYPEVQEEVHAAIDTSIGKICKPSLQDRSRVPFVEAVLLEVQRCNTIAPLTVPHRTTQDTTLNGYFIPKDTTMVVSLWSIFKDKEHWGDPENFRPARFIDENGKLIKDETFIPFGIGKRLCPGEALTRNILFIFFTALMQKFSVVLPPNCPKPSTISLPGFTTAPKPFEVIFQSR